MPAMPMPQLDQDSCRGWSENDVDLYNSYDFFLAKMQVERRKVNPIFGKLTRKKPWTRNHGPIMRGVRKNPSPHIRQYVAPQPLTAEPKVDINNLVESTTDTILYWQDFETPALNWYPSFNDFLDHVTDFGEDMSEKIERFEELFYRWMMFQMSPYIIIATENGCVVRETTPFSGTTVFNPATDGKSTAVLAALTAEFAGTGSHLTMKSLNTALTKFAVNLGIKPFSGSGMPSGDNKGIDGKYLLITHEEAWHQFSFDPTLLNYKNCNLDIINGQFMGSLFGRLTTRLEQMPLFMKNDGTFAAPEVRVQTNVALNQGETVPNPDYVNVETSPWAISFLSGEVGYDAIEVGPPPAAFTGNSKPHNFNAMQWNGEVYLTKDFLLECVEPETGAVRQKLNSKGRWLRYEATAAMGIFPRQRRSIIPVLHKRKQTY